MNVLLKTTLLLTAALAVTTGCASGPCTEGEYVLEATYTDGTCGLSGTSSVFFNIDADGRLSTDMPDTTIGGDVFDDCTSIVVMRFSSAFADSTPFNAELVLTLSTDGEEVTGNGVVKLTYIGGECGQAMSIKGLIL